MSETHATIQPLAISHIDHNAPANGSDDETERVKHEDITGVDEEQISGKMDIIGITDWTDIPDWKEGDGSPLMELPLEILDEIFCVRPELSVNSSSYTAAWTLTLRFESMLPWPALASSFDTK